MCGHIFLGYHNHQALRQPQALWRCSVCGRQSHMPLDCCARPDDEVFRSEGLVYASARRLGALISRVQTRFRAWLLRRRQPDVVSALTRDKALTARALLDERLSDIEPVAPVPDLREYTCDEERELQMR